MSENKTYSPEELFQAAVVLPDHVRVVEVERLCNGNAELREEVLTLLSAYSRASELLEQPASPLLLNPPFPLPAIGSRIAGYRLIREIGKGGYGVVYEAMQDSPVRRTVALKILQWRGGRDLIARFEQERQTVAALDHPNIARLYEAGGVDTPYFAMEFVRGDCITDYCTRCELSVARRVELLMQVCSAVQYAHQRGIIHRDLKPANILVTEVDGRPLAKVIDFGIAKIVSDLPVPALAVSPSGIQSSAGPARNQSSGEVASGLMLTKAGDLLGTPGYMSPEQTRSAGEADTRSDVFSLGAVLFHLLSEHSPPQGQARIECEKASRGHAGERPQLSAPADREADVARRSTLPRELDWIVRKAMSGKPDARYASVSELAADLARYLANKPVEAGPPSIAYRTRKFIRRNRVVVGASGLAVLGYLAASAALTALYVQSQVAGRTTRQSAEWFRWSAYAATIGKALSGIESGDYQGARRDLELTSPELRDWEHKYLTKLVSGGEIHSVPLGDQIWTLATDAKSGRVAVGLSSGKVVLWRNGLAGNAEELVMHTQAVSALSFGGGGQALVSATAKGDTVIWRLSGVEITHAVLTPGSGRVAMSADGWVVCTSTPEGQLLVGSPDSPPRRLGSSEAGELNALAVSADGNDLIVARRSGAVEVWKLDLDAIVAKWTVDGGAHAVAVAADGSCFAAGGRRGVVTVRSNNSQLLRILSVNEGATVRSLAFSTDARSLAVATTVGAVQLYIVDGVEAPTLVGVHLNRVEGVGFAPGPVLMSGSTDGSLKTWNLSERATRTPTHRGAVIGTAFSFKGHSVISAGWDGQIRQTALAEGSPENAAAEPERITTFDSGGEYLLSGAGKDLTLWSADSLQPVRRSKETRIVKTVALSPDGKELAVAFADGQIEVRPSTLLQSTSVQPSVPMTLPADGGDVTAMTLADGRLAIGMSRGKVLVASSRGSKATQTLVFEGVAVRSLRFSSDGHDLFVGASDGCVRIVDTQSWRTRRELPCVAKSVLCMDVSANGKRLAIGYGDGTIRIWTPDPGLEMLVMRPGLGEVKSLRFGRRGELAAGFSGGAVRVFEH